MPAAPTVFLSYAHAEQGVANELCRALGSNGLFVLIDTEMLRPGEDIAGFGRRMVKRADATVCLVSSVSLESMWVVFEASTALEHEYDNPSARLIACSTDRCFLEDTFHLTIASKLDERIASLKAILREHFEKGLGVEDLGQKHDRLINMRESLGAILARLRNSLTLELDRDDRNGIVQAAIRIADHVRALKGQQPSRSDPRDIRARAQTLRDSLVDYLVLDDTDTSLGQVLQFAQEYSLSDRTRVRNGISYVNTLRRIERLEREGKLSIGEAEELRQRMLVKLLELIDEIEANPQLPLAS
jgi:TIR domain